MSVVVSTTAAFDVIHKEATFAQRINSDATNLSDQYLHATTRPKYHEHFTLTDMRPLVAQRQQARVDVFYEEFYDTGDFSLMKSGCWLRRRMHKWVYKFGTVNQNGVVEYREETAVDKIMSRLEIYGRGSNPGEICPNRYASFPTSRYTYHSDKNSSLWIDVSEFAENLYYAVGTVEIPVLNGSIVDIWSAVGDTRQFSLPAASKITAFLFYFLPERFESLAAHTSPLCLESFGATNIFEPDSETVSSAESEESEYVREMREKFPDLFQLSFVSK